MSGLFQSSRKAYEELDALRLRCNALESEVVRANAAAEGARMVLSGEAPGDHQRIAKLGNGWWCLLCHDGGCIFAYLLESAVRGSWEELGFLAFDVDGETAVVQEVRAHELNHGVGTMLVDYLRSCADDFGFTQMEAVRLPESAAEDDKVMHFLAKNGLLPDEEAAAYLAAEARDGEALADAAGDGHMSDAESGLAAVPKAVEGGSGKTFDVESRARHGRLEKPRFLKRR